MPKYIDADALKKYILETGFYCDTYADREYSAEIIDTFPTADVQEVKHGRWIYWDKNRVMCSECKLEPYAGKGADSFKYCPNCGADMRGGDDA